MAGSIDTMLSNPAYTQLLVQLTLARRHLEAASDIARELKRDKLLTDECSMLEHALGDMAYAELRVRDKAR